MKIKRLPALRRQWGSRRAPRSRTVLRIRSVLYVVLAALFGQALLVYVRGIMPRAEPSLTVWLMPALIAFAALWALYAAWRSLQKARDVVDDS